MMSERETAQASNDRAAEWIARMDREGHDPAVRAELKAWLAGDDRRRGAYFRAKVAWNMLDRARVLRAGKPPAYEVAAAGGARFSRRRVIPIGRASCRERVVQYGSPPVVAGFFTKKRIF